MDPRQAEWKPRDLINCAWCGAPVIAAGCKVCASCGRDQETGRRATEARVSGSGMKTEVTGAIVTLVLVVAYAYHLLGGSESPAGEMFTFVLRKAIPTSALVLLVCAAITWGAMRLSGWKR
jgi:hypothetical protein